MENQTQSNDPSEVKTEAPKSKERIYYARAKGYQIANLVPEKWSGSRLIQREGSLRFEENQWVTSNPAEIKHIEESNGFANGDILLCKDMKEFYEIKESRRRIRQGIRTFKNEMIDRTRIE